MKLINSIFLLLAVSVVTVFSVGEPPFKCPNKEILQHTKADASKNTKEKGCECSDKFIMTCTNIDQSWLKLFQPLEIFSVDTIVIQNSSNFPFFSDKFFKEGSSDPNGPKPSGIKAKNVIFILENESPKIEPHAMRTLLAIASETIKVKSTMGPILINNPTFQSSLTKFALENVIITESEEKVLENLNSLTTLQLNKVSFDKVLPTFVIKGISRVEITECPSLAKNIQYVRPDPCPNNEIILNLQNNAGLEDLLMDSMFDKEKKCKYYIDLSESKLNPNFLTAKKNVFKQLSKGQIFLIMREVKSVLKCDQCVFNWYNSMPQYVHSVYCTGTDGKAHFIDQFVKDKLAVCQT